LPLSHIDPKTGNYQHASGTGFGVLFAAAAALWLAAASCSAVAAAVPASLPPFLQTMIASGKIKLLRSFATDKPGLIGYVVQHGGQNQLVFGEAGYMFVGQLFSPKGQDLVALYSAQYLPKPDVAATVKELENSGHLIGQGPATAPLLYVFNDPNCIFCHRFYQMAEPLVQAGRLQLRWAMVGFLKPSSAGRAVAMLSASNPVQALQANETHFDVSAEEGGMALAQKAHPKLQALLKAHYTAMQSVGGSGTPTLLYRTDASHWAVRVGLPSAKWLSAYAAGKLPAAGDHQR
jgi:thiol:disulfide interchange protein DsbG